MQDLSLQVHRKYDHEVRANFCFFFTIGPLVEETMDSVKQIFDINTFAVLRVCKAVVPFMAKRRSGTIVNIGSIVGEMYATITSFFVLFT